jgi:hypothetical protein
MWADPFVRECIGPIQEPATTRFDSRESLHHLTAPTPTRRYADTLLRSQYLSQMIQTNL